MNTMEKYIIWLKVIIKHEYYDEKACPLALAPAPETACFLDKYHIKIRRLDNTWMLYGTQRKVDFIRRDLPYLTFELRPTQDAFYYVSKPLNAHQNADYQITKDKKNRVWHSIMIPIIQQETSVCIESQEKYFEYILFPREGREHVDHIQVKEERDRIRFQEQKKIEWIDQSAAYQIISTEKVKLKQRYSYKIQVKKKMKEGEKVVSRSIPAPLPNQLSVTNPSETITAYFNL